MIGDGADTTVVDTTSVNTYAWIMTLDNRQVTDGTAFYDSVTFNELWRIDPIGA